MSSSYPFARDDCEPCSGSWSLQFRIRFQDRFPRWDLFTRLCPFRSVFSGIISGGLMNTRNQTLRSSLLFDMKQFGPQPRDCLWNVRILPGTMHTPFAFHVGLIIYVPDVQNDRYSPRQSTEVLVSCGSCDPTALH